MKFIDNIHYSTQKTQPMTLKCVKTLLFDQVLFKFHNPSREQDHCFCHETRKVGFLAGKEESTDHLFYPSILLNPALLIH